MNWSEKDKAEVFGESHPKGGNAVFGDGHARWYRVAELGPDGEGLYSPNANYTYAATREFFRGANQ